MASKVEIVNMALVQLGKETLIAVPGSTTNGGRCDALYDIVRKIVLQAHPWNGSTKQVALNLLTETPVFKWTYVHQLPTDCIRVLKTDEDVGNERQWQRMGNKLYSDYSTLNIEYIYNNEDTTLFSPGLVVALSARLEAELTYPITGSTTLAEGKLKIYDDLKLPEAKALDAQEGGAQIADDNQDSWIESRS